VAKTVETMSTGRFPRSPSRLPVRRLFEPAIAASAAIAAVITIRMASSLAWLDSALVGKDAKFAPDFISGAGLAMRVTSTFVHTAIAPGVAAFLRDVIVPNAHLFAVLLAVGDLAIGISLFFGLLTRLGGFFEIVRALTDIAITGSTGADTAGYNGMLIVAGAIAIGTGAGRTFGLDRVLLTRFPNSKVLRLVA